jgi:hypothetical protein
MEGILMTALYAHLSFAWSSWTYRRELAYWRLVERRAQALNPAVRLAYVARPGTGTPQAVFEHGVTLQRRWLDFHWELDRHVQAVAHG